MRQADTLEDLRKQQESQQQEIRALDKLSGKYMAAIKALLKLKSGKRAYKGYDRGVYFKNICLSGKAYRGYIYIYSRLYGRGEVEWSVWHYIYGYP